MTMFQRASLSLGDDTFTVTRTGAEKIKSARVSNMRAFSFNLSPPFIFAPKYRWRCVRLQQNSLVFACQISAIHDSESDVERVLWVRAEEKSELTVTLARQES